MSEHIAYLKTLPLCQLHKNENPPSADYDALTVFGTWAYVCESCFEKFATYPELGIGKGCRIKLSQEEPF